MRARILDGALVVLTVCAVIITALVVRREFSSPQAQPAPVRPTAVADWRGYARDGHRMGPVDAPVTIVVFSDFQCPFCGMLMSRLRQLRDVYPREVAVIYRHYPLADHPHAVAAARASECAAEQGRFSAFHDALFAAQDSIGAVGWDRFAARAGVGDLPRFEACAAATGPLAPLERDTAAARRLRVSGTPTLLINELRFHGAVRQDTLEAYVRRALRTASPARS
jgi:protein-disulfide isomerase